MLFLWRPAETRPFAVAKVALPAGASALDAEAHALEELASLPAGVAGRIPRLLARDCAGGLEVLVVTATRVVASHYPRSRRWATASAESSTGEPIERASR